MTLTLQRFLEIIDPIMGSNHIPGDQIRKEADYISKTVNHTALGFFFHRETAYKKLLEIIFKFLK